jgi:hypothetical protein
MARNRKNQSVGIRFGPALKAVTLCLLIGGSAVGYVWQKDQLRQLGARITDGEQALKTLRLENEKLRWELDALRSSASLQRLVEQHQLGLVQPSPDQVIRLPEPAVIDPGLPGDEIPVQYLATRRSGPGASY